MRSQWTWALLGCVFASGLGLTAEITSAWHYGLLFSVYTCMYIAGWFGCQKRLTT